MSRRELWRARTPLNCSGAPPGTGLLVQAAVCDCDCPCLLTTLTGTHHLHPLDDAVAEEAVRRLRAGELVQARVLDVYGDPVTLLRRTAAGTVIVTASPQIAEMWSEADEAEDDAEFDDRASALVTAT